MWTSSTAFRPHPSIACESCGKLANHARTLPNLRKSCSSAIHSHALAASCHTSMQLDAATARLPHDGHRSKRTMYPRTINCPRRASVLSCASGDGSSALAYGNLTAYWQSNSRTRLKISTRRGLIGQHNPGVGRKLTRTDLGDLSGGYRPDAWYFHRIGEHGKP